MFKLHDNIIKALEILQNSKFTEGNIDPFLYVKNNAKGIVYVALKIEDNLMLGNIEAIDDATAAIKENRLVLKILEGLQNCLSCETKFSMDRKRAQLGQPHCIKTWLKCLAIA